jgi:tRNA(adenine34) deaminase
MSVDYIANMQAALIEAEEALAAGEFPVGCVLVAGRQIVSRGRRKNSSGQSMTELDHAEMVALRTLAFSGAKFNGPLTAYATMEPCLMCYTGLLLNGVSTIVYAYEDVMGGGTAVALDRLPPLYRTMKPEIISGICREESLQLFKRFFNNPENTYWQGSMLASYTMQQETK